MVKSKLLLSLALLSQSAFAQDNAEFPSKWFDFEFNNNLKQELNLGNESLCLGFSSGNLSLNGCLLDQNETLYNGLFSRYGPVLRATLFDINENLSRDRVYEKRKFSSGNYKWRHIKVDFNEDISLNWERTKTRFGHNQGSSKEESLGIRFSLYNSKSGFSVEPEIGHQRFRSGPIDINQNAYHLKFRYDF